MFNRNIFYRVLMEKGVKEYKALLERFFDEVLGSPLPPRGRRGSRENLLRMMEFHRRFKMWEAKELKQLFGENSHGSA